MELREQAPRPTLAQKLGDVTRANSQAFLTPVIHSLPLSLIGRFAFGSGSISPCHPAESLLI